MAERRTTKKASAGAKKASSASSRSKASSTKRSAAAKKGGQARGRQQRAQKAAKTTARAATKPARRAGVEAKTVAELREALRKNLIKPSGMVLLSRDRIEEALGEAVKNGQITAKGARSIAGDLLERGRKQTNDVLQDLEQLLGRGRGEIDTRTSSARKAAGGAAKGARKQAASARGRATRAASPALAQVDRARRSAGVGPSFPILGYDELNATQIQRRLSGLTAPQLRKVRDHERRNANRKTILSAIESKLG
jgi:polyhydroxyalkanoate synthesis regulator phasin